MGKEGGFGMSFLHELNSLLFKMTISYFLYFWFFPKKIKLKYIPIVLLIFVLNGLGYEYLDHLFHPQENNFWMYFVSNSLTYLGFGVVFYAIYSVKSSYKNQLVMDRLIQERQQAEISVLKARVNPHFLFNTLNTIYANALKKDDKTPDLILKLSDGFRYVLHEGQKEFVTIEQEIQHIKDYVHLQQERLAQKVTINLSIDIDSPTQKLAPLLLIGFLENAFKYTSILKGQNHQIDINLQLKNKQLTFFCSNPFNVNFIQELDSDWKESGIGLQNIQQRLELIYPQKHTLEIKSETAFFKVKLKVSL